MQPKHKHTHLVDVAIRRELHKDLQFFLLDVDGVVVLAEENFNLLREQIGALLHNQ